MADITIAITIPEAKVDATTMYFLAKRPIPQEQEVVDGEPQFNEDGSPKMIDSYGPKAWFKKCLVDYAHSVCYKGKKIVNSQQAETGLFI